MTNELAKQIYQANKLKGWHEKERTFNELILLIKSEMYEAFESLRKGAFASSLIVQQEYNSIKYGFFNPNAFKVSIKDTFEDEIADVAIRVLDMAAAKNINAKIVKPIGLVKDLSLFSYFDIMTCECYVYCTELEVGKMLGWCIEVAKLYDFDLNAHISLKLAYNKTRPHKHGKLF